MGYRFALEKDNAGVLRDNPFNDFDGCCFSGAIWTE